MQMRVNQKIYLIGVILLFLLNLFSLISCKKLKEDENQNVKFIDYDYDSYEYWYKLIQEEKQDLSFVTNWMKKNNYFISLELDGRNGDIYIMPNIDKLRKKIESEIGFNRIKSFLMKKQLRIKNDWAQNKRIIFFYEFYYQDINTRGNYCMAYVEDRLTTEEIYDNYKRLDENYYSHVIFYQ